MRVLITGSREFTDAAVIRTRLERLPESTLLIEGGARGADRLGRLEARKLGFHVATVEALWDFYGKLAGGYRNSAMLQLLPELVLGYPVGRSVGTRDCLRKARALDVPIEVHES